MKVKSLANEKPVRRTDTTQKEHESPCHCAVWRSRCADVCSLVCKATCYRRNSEVGHAVSRVRVQTATDTDTDTDMDISPW